MNQPSIKNYGVLLGERITDYRAGLVAGALPYEDRNKNGDWESNLPSEEKQYNDNGDSMSCVTFAELNGIETQEMFMTGTYTEYSDRWIAKISGTTREGNYLWRVADAIRKYGLVKEESYPRPEGAWSWDEYHKEIPDSLFKQLEAEGKEWLSKWDVKYEFVDFNRDSLMKHIKHAPLTVVIPGHAVLNFRTSKEIIEYFDTYPPHKKSVQSIQSAMKLVLYPKEQAIDDDFLLVDLNYMDSGPHVARLLRALRRLGWGYRETEKWPPNYNQQVADLVLNFQKANLLRTDWAYWMAIWYYRGKKVDQYTRNVINLALSKRI